MSLNSTKFLPMMIPAKWIPRFWKRVQKTETCWLWLGNINDRGYGRFIPTEKSQFRAHRISYELCVGPIPPGMELDHLCRNRACVRPDHLEAVKHKVNMERGEKRAALMCTHGHPWTAANTYWRPDTQTRQCRACHNRIDKRRYHMAPLEERRRRNRQQYMRSSVYRARHPEVS